MSEASKNSHLEVDREHLRHQAFLRYQRLKNLSPSQLNSDDQLFLENFAAAMHYLWGITDRTHLE